MTAPALLALLLLMKAPGDTGQAVASDSIAGPVHSALVAGVRAAADTIPRRRRSIEVGDWYERRLRIHRYGAYAVVPLFALQAIAGNQLYDDPRNGPEWAKNGMRYGATALAGVFTSNTMTGLWNLWDSRNVEQGRARRTVHALLMLTSDAGFTYAGSRLAEEAENSVDKRRQHRVWAYGSMATSLAGIGVMTLWREDKAR
ncbi:hypothetical protein BH09GEM1_BH09GEM1_28590 [soil metagenome]